MKHHRRSLLGAVRWSILAACLLCHVGAARSSDAAAADTEATRRSLADLALAISDAEVVSVILHLDRPSPYVPDGILDHSRRQAQRAEIADQADTILEFIDDVEPLVGVVRRYETLPFVGLDLTGLQIQVLIGAGITGFEDVPSRPPAPRGDDPGTIEAPDTYRNIASAGATAVIALIDTGVAADHPGLENRVDYEACFSGFGREPKRTSTCPGEALALVGEIGAASPVCQQVQTTETDCDHGTVVASLLVGDAHGILGAGRLYAYQVYTRPDVENPVVSAFVRDRLAAYDDIAKKVEEGAPIRIVNLSIASSAIYVDRHACIQHGYEEYVAASMLASHGVFIVAAAGNGGSSVGISRPACLPNVVSVSAVDVDDAVLGDSNVGPDLDFFAPGSFGPIATPLRPSAYVFGTSFASPIVAGLLADLLMRGGHSSVDDARNALGASSDPVVDVRRGPSGTERPRVPKRQ